METDAEHDAPSASARPRIEPLHEADLAERYRVLSRLTSDFAYRVRLEGGATVAEWATEGWRRFVDLTPEEACRPNVWLEFVHPEDRPRALETFQRLLAGEAITEEFRVVAKSGEIRWMRNYSEPISEGGAVVGFYGAVQDVTSYKVTEAQLRESEERFRILSELSSDYAVLFTIDDDGSIRWEWLTESVTRDLDVEIGEPGPDALARILHPEDLEIVLDALTSTLEGGRAEGECRILLKTGEIRWVRFSGQAVFDEASGRVVGAYGAAKDITDRKRVDDAMKQADEERRRLVARIVAAQDEERRRIAWNLHDDAIQLLTAAVFELGVLRQRLPKPQATTLSAVVQKLQFALRQARILTAELYSPMFELEGLAATVESLVREARSASGIQFTLDNRIRRPLDPERAAVCFRIIQEAVANIRKHSGATKAWVWLWETEGGVRIRVSDNGVGFDPAESRVAGRRLGLATMRERAHMVGGSWQVQSAPGRGTAVGCWIPYGDEMSDRAPADEA